MNFQSKSYKYISIDTIEKPKWNKISAVKKQTWQQCISFKQTQV